MRGIFSLQLIPRLNPDYLCLLLRYWDILYVISFYLWKSRPISVWTIVWGVVNLLPEFLKQNILKRILMRSVVSTYLYLFGEPDFFHVHQLHKHVNVRYAGWKIGGRDVFDNGIARLKLLFVLPFVMLDILHLTQLWVRWGTLRT